MLEHGRWANGSSSGFCGANAVGLDAIFVSSKCKLIILLSLMLGSASVGESFDTADSKYRAITAARVGCPSNGHFVPEIFGEALRRESIRLELRDQRPRLFLDQNVLAVLFVDATCQ